MSNSVLTCAAEMFRGSSVGSIEYVTLHVTVDVVSCNVVWNMENQLSMVTSEISIRLLHSAILLAVRGTTESTGG
jgi:hypothetical protein